MFVSNRDGSAPEHYLDALKIRVRKKRMAGKPLGAVESYFSQRGFGSGSNLYGPSRATVAAEVLFAFARPLPTIALLSLIILAEGTTSAYFQSNLEEDFSEQALETQAIEEDYEGTEFASLVDTVISDTAIAAQEQEAKAPYDFDRKFATSEKLHGLVEFITGVIAVYRPSEKNAGELARHIVEQAHTQEVDPLYVASVIAVESSFRAKARSHVGATGLMQVMPDTAKEIQEKHNVKVSSATLSDPKRNIELGITYLKHLQKNFGSRDLALQAYNWGPTNVSLAKKGRKRTPSSVRLYSRKIMELTLRWNKHFERASENAAELHKALSLTT